MFKENKNFFKEFQKIQDKALLRTGFYFEGKLKEEIKEKAYDTGDLARSVNTRKYKQGVIRIGSNRIQAWIMEYGRRPGKFPPLDVLVGWGARHGFIKGGATKTYDELDSKKKGKIYILARSIAKKGIAPRGIFSGTFKKEAKNLQNKFQKYLQYYLK